MLRTTGSVARLAAAAAVVISVLVSASPATAQGMWGGRGGGHMGGWCGPMMEGMMIGGQMPPGADPAQLPDSQSAGAKLLNQYCTQCHGLPTPELHSAGGWAPVTQRMAMRMQWMSNYGRTPIQAPTPAELQTLTEYLRQHASK